MIQTYKDLKGRVWDQPGIPKWIFRAGNEPLENLNSEIVDLYTKQLYENPNYEMFYFSEQDREDFIRDLKNQSIKYTYDKLIPPTYKVDFFKYVLMHNYGGVYFDFSMTSLISLDELIPNRFQEVLARDSVANDGLCAGFMASVPKTKLMEWAIEICTYNTKHSLMCKNPLDVTGPGMFSTAYKLKNLCDSITTGDLGDAYIYDFKDPDYIYDGDTPVIKIRIPNHYSLLYQSGENNLYYAKLWNENRIYKTHDTNL
jgi:hypothetical protein